MWIKHTFTVYYVYEQEAVSVWRTPVFQGDETLEEKQVPEYVGIIVGIFHADRSKRLLSIFHATLFCDILIT